MENLVKQAFAHVETIGPHVQEGHYDLMGPDGEIILPVLWDTTIQPGWQVTMRMWPMDKYPLQNQGLPDPRNLTPEQRHRYLQQQMHMRQAAQAAQSHHRHSHGVAQPMPMRPPFGMGSGGVPPVPPPPPAHFDPYDRPPPGPAVPRMPPAVHNMDARPERKKADGKAAKKTIHFFAGSKKPHKKSGSSKKYVVQEWY